MTDAASATVDVRTESEAVRAARKALESRRSALEVNESKLTIARDRLRKVVVRRYGKPTTGGDGDPHGTALRFFEAHDEWEPFASTTNLGTTVDVRGGDGRAYECLPEHNTAPGCLLAVRREEARHTYDALVSHVEGVRQSFALALSELESACAAEMAERMAALASEQVKAANAQVAATDAQVTGTNAQVAATNAQVTATNAQVASSVALENHTKGLKRYTAGLFFATIALVIVGIAQFVQSCQRDDHTSVTTNVADAYGSVSSSTAVRTVPSNAVPSSSTVVPSSSRQKPTRGDK